MRRRTIVPALALLLVLPACEESGDTAEMQGTGPAAETSPVMSEADLRQAVETANDEAEQLVTCSPMPFSSSTGCRRRMRRESSTAM